MITQDTQQDWYDFFTENYVIRYYITLTFKYNLSQPLITQSMNFLLHILNTKIFTRNYQKTNRHITAFTFREKKLDKMRYRPEQLETKRYYKRDLYKPHYHILVVDDPEYNRRDKLSFRDHLSANLHKVTTPSGHRIFYHDCVDFQEVYSCDVVEYCNKKMGESDNTNHIGIITLGGITEID